jgi:hypothetical protein
LLVAESYLNLRNPQLLAMVAAIRSQALPSEAPV